MTTGCFTIMLLVSASIPYVSCRRDHEYYYNKYHKGSSTTEAVSTSDYSRTEISSTKEGTSTVQQISTSSSEDTSSEEISSSEGSPTTKLNANETSLQHGVSSNDGVKFAFMAKIGVIVSSVVAFVFILGCIVCCCPSCCRGRQRRGIIIASRSGGQATQIQPPQPVVSTYPQQPTVIQHYPPNLPQGQPQQFPPQYTQEPVQHFPPQYNQQHAQQPPYSPVEQQPSYSPDQQPPYTPFQQQTQYSPNAVQFYNPPEAPPPYENPSAPHY